MTATGLFALATRDLLAARSRAFISAIGIAVGVLVLTVVIALGLGARDLVLKEVVRELPLDMVEVVPKTLDLGLFKVNAGALFGTKALDAATIARLAQIPGVSAVYPKLDVNVPMGASGGTRLFGRRLYSDLFMTGMPPELLAPEVGADFKDAPDIIPVVVSDQLIEVYNASIAPALGSPQLTAQTLVGFEFDINFGRSLMLGNRGARNEGSERARIVGVSRFAMRMGVTVPIDTGRRMLQKYGDAAGEHFTGVLLRAASAADVPAIAQGVEALGFAVDQSADKTRHVLTTATALASSVGFLVLMLAALNIAHSFLASLSERRRELGVLRAVGARRVDLVGMVLAQAALLGVIGGIVGLCGARLAGCIIDASVRHFAPQLPFKPASFFVFSLPLCLGAVVSAVAAALLGALWPAVRAARTPIVRALAD